jgi:hypothetical protein
MNEHSKVLIITKYLLQYSTVQQTYTIHIQLLAQCEVKKQNCYILRATSFRDVANPSAWSLTFKPFIQCRVIFRSTAHTNRLANHLSYQFFFISDLSPRPFTISHTAGNQSCITCSSNSLAHLTLQVHYSTWRMCQVTLLHKDSILAADF